MIAPPLNRLVLYVRDLPKIAAFYQKHFGFVATVSETKEAITLQSPSGGCTLFLLQASKGPKIGQSCVKMLFDVPDIATFRKARAKAGLKFGPIHHGQNYQYANARDPAKNLIQISNSYLVT
jgi:predicted enzyme related to lactoylglutathione lyase